MHTVTLLARAYNAAQLKDVETNLKTTLRGLDVKTETLGTIARGWPQISVSGEDETVALRYLTDEIGLCPASLDNMEEFSTMKGYLTALGKSADELHVDVGVFLPSIVDAVIPLASVQAQLADGRKLALGKLAELFGFHESLPLTVKVSSIDKENNRVEAVLSEKQLRLYKSWTRSLLDRLLVLGASFSEVQFALKSADFNREVVKVESLGMFEHAIVCKLGTDAAGLIPKIGRRLRKTALSVYNPRRIMEFFGADSALLTS